MAGFTDNISGFFETVKNGFQAVFDFFAELGEFVKSLFVSIFEALWVFFQDAFIWIIESLLSLVVAGLSAIDFNFSVFNPQTYISDIPPGVIAVWGAIGLDDCLAIIVSAIGIRLVLQLIPFTRLGS